MPQALDPAHEHRTDERGKASYTMSELNSCHLRVVNTSYALYSDGLFTYSVGSLVSNKQLIGRVLATHDDTIWGFLSPHAVSIQVVTTVSYVLVPFTRSSRDMAVTKLAVSG